MDVSVGGHRLCRGEEIKRTLVDKRILAICDLELETEVDTNVSAILQGIIFIKSAMYNGLKVWKVKKLF